MTDKQFWMKLDQLTQKKDKSHIMREAGDIIRQAYDENLLIIIACVGDGNGHVQQMCVRKADADEDTPRSNWLMCYTSMKLADSDRNIEWDKVHVRDVVDNALNNPAIAGLVFNRHDESQRMIVSKVFFSKEDVNNLDYIAELAKLIFASMSGEKRKR